MVQPEPVCVCLPLTCCTLFQPPTGPPSPSDQGIDVWYPQGSGKTHIHQMGHMVHYV